MKSLACHQLFDNNQSSLALINLENGVFSCQQVPSTEAREENLFYLTADAHNNILLFDVDDNKLIVETALPQNAFPGYAYYDPYKAMTWVSNDGDKETGCVENCKDGSSIIVLQNNQNGKIHNIELSKQICIGRGHHVVAFSKPNEQHPQIPELAYVSNLLDGTITVLNNKMGKDYLNRVDQINLLNIKSEKDPNTNIPNSAFPHGMVFSPITGKIYNLNNGYGTISVIDPILNEIVDEVEMKVSSNLLLHPDGRYIVGKGADRKNSPEHVIGRLSIYDLVENQVCYRLDVDDFYPSTYRFSPDGSRLYVTTAATGKGVQRDNLNITDLFIYDTSNLPKIELIEKINTGVAECGRRPMAFYKDENGQAKYLFVPNPTEGTVSILNIESNQLIEKITVGTINAKEITFSFWNDRFYGS